MRHCYRSLLLLVPICALASTSEQPVFIAGHASLQSWLLPETVPHPADNAPTQERVDLGKKLFFDPRLSGDGNMSCATCHNPMLGWSDGLPTARGWKSKMLGRASPTITNTGYNTIQMWDGRAASLEDQATGPMLSTDEMNSDIEGALAFLTKTPGYAAVFEKAYPGEGITTTTLSKAIASFERTVVSRNAPFDRWVRGEKNAMTQEQIAGFNVFVDPQKGNCAVCHSAPNFTDNGFHNVGLESHGRVDADPGRHAIRPVAILKGAFKTPTLRDITDTAPYFHDGSVSTLEAVIEHYVTGGADTGSLSPNMKSLDLTNTEKVQLAAFLRALTSPPQPVTLPNLPQ